MLTVTFTIYWIIVGGLFLYALNSIYLVWSFRRHRKGQLERAHRIRAEYWAKAEEEDLPTVTIQLPIYNERYVAGRLIHAAAKVDYPRDKLEIQVLDDSTDDTVDVVAEHVDHYRKLGIRIVHLHRDNRDGYKAGALRDGVAATDSQLLAVFDADFVPEPDFLRKTVPFFEDGKVGMVQARWGHANEKFSWLTRVQAIALDGHFGIEQGGRGWGGFFLNFNGTAGIWRKQAIEDAGGWEADTLTEDIDLSYRAQLAGYRMEYVVDVEVPAELPADVFAFKSQQRRWAKGSIECAKKLLPKIYAARIPFRQKVQATLHVTQHIVYCLVVMMALLGLPLTASWHGDVHVAYYVAMIGLLVMIFAFPSILYVQAQKELRSDWRKRLRYMPVLMMVGTGVAVSNSRAVMEALLGIKTGFVRTPKRSMTGSKRDVKKAGTYKLPLDLTFVFEALLSVYCLVGLGLYLSTGRVIIGPFLALFSVAFGTMAIATFREAVSRRRENVAAAAADAEEAEEAELVMETEREYSEVLAEFRGDTEARKVAAAAV
ncbi:MAG: glycosyltransferase [Planctomycetota bacterium]